METWTDEQLRAAVDRQRRFFLTGTTRPLSFRRQQLKKLADALSTWEPHILDAVWKDLHKGEFEAFTSEIGLVKTEIDFALRHLRRWTGRRRVWTPLIHFPARSFVVSDPKGVVGIMAPWNYPVQLVLAPLVAAIAAGNCCLVKPSEHAAESERVLTAMLREIYPPEYITVVTGDAEVGQRFSALPLDHLFFTGGTEVGRKIAEAAARNLTPTTLELGGKSPAIVDDTVDLPVAARRITWGKFLNAGQVCIAPDYVVVHHSIVEKFVMEVDEAIHRFFGADPQHSHDYGRIVSARHFGRLRAFLEADHPGDRIVHGGHTDEEERYIEPTVVRLSGWDSPLMQAELFGPIMPILTYDSLDELLKRLAAMNSPLALYLFSRSNRTRKRVIETLRFGGGAVNDTITHLVNPRLPFGGVGTSGYGVYHGKAGFDTFTHPKIIQVRSLLDIPLKYPPYENKIKLIRRFMR